MEQWAFNILMAILPFLGVYDASLHPNEDWNIDSPWTQQADGSYKIELASSRIAERCTDEGYLIVSSPFIALTEVFADDRLVFTNSPGKRWYLSSSHYRYAISCKYLENSSLIRVHVSSAIKFFATLSSLPHISPRYPFSQAMYDELYILTAILVLQLGIVGYLFAYRLLTPGIASLFFMYNLCFCLLMYGHSPGILSNLHVTTAHTLVLLAACGALAYFSAFSLAIRNVRAMHINFFLFCVFIVAISYGKSNLTQLFIDLFMPVAIFGLFALFIYKLRAGKLTATLYFFVWLFAFKDCYMSQVLRDGYLYLSMLTAVVAGVGIWELVQRISQNSKNLEIAQLNLLSERQILERISKYNEISREIIHDVKSPLTALEFGLKGSDSNSILSEASKRLKDILNRVDSEEFKKQADWYDIAALEACLTRVITEKNIAEHCRYKNKIKFTDLVFFDRVDMGVVIAELVDNSLKYGRVGSPIDFEIYRDGSFVLLKVINEYDPDSAAGTSDNIGRRGYSIQGSGLGLNNVRKKVELMGGQFTTAASSGRFTAQIQLRIRE